MTLFHLTVKVVSRSAGRNAVQAAAYRAGERLVCQRTGSVFNYERRHGVVATSIVIPQGIATMSRTQLWNAAEAAERRCNSTVAREVEIALPHELGRLARERLVSDFAQQLVERYNVGVDDAIHKPSRRGDQRNHHAHVLMTTREIKPDGTLGAKVRCLDDRTAGPAEVTKLRALWASLCNAALEAAGVAERVDHRSHAERRIDAVPGRKLGVGAVGYEARTALASRRRVDHEADTIAVKAAVLHAVQRVEAAHEADRHRRQHLVKATVGQLRQQFGAVTQMIVGGHPHEAIDRALTHAIGRSQVGPTSDPSRPQPSSALIVRKSHPSAPDDKPASDQSWQRDRAEEEATAMRRRVALALEAERRAQIIGQKTEAKQTARQPPLVLDAWSHPSEFEERSGLAEPQSERKVTEGASYSPGQAKQSADENMLRSLGNYDEDGAEESSGVAPSFLSPSPERVRPQLPTGIAKHFGDMPDPSGARLAQLAALSCMAVKVLEAPPPHCSPQSSDLTSTPEELARNLAWNDEMREGGDRHQDTPAAAEAGSNEYTSPAVAKIETPPASQAAVAEPDDVADAGVGGEVFLAGPVATCSTTNSDPVSLALGETEAVASTVPAPVSDPTLLRGAVDGRWRAIAADYYLWLLGRPDHIWSKDIAGRIAAAVRVDLSTLADDARQRCRDRYNHARPRQITREQRMALVVEVTKVAKNAGFDELLAIRELVLAAIRRAKEAAASGPSQHRRRSDKGIGKA